MTETLFPLMPFFVAVVSTYLLHSTLLLGAAWLGLAATGAGNHLLRERIWKTAAVAGMLTAPLHLAVGISMPMFDVRVAGNNNTAPTPDERSATRVNQNASDSSQSLDLLQRTGAALAASHDFAPADPIAGPTLDSNDASIRREPTAAIPESPKHEPADPAKAHSADNVASVARKAESTKEPSTSIDATRPSWFLARWRQAAPAAVLVLLAFAGIALMRLVLQSLVFHRKMSHLRPITDPTVCRTLDALKQSASVRSNVGLFSSSLYSEPVAFGLLRWKIVLPEGIEKELTREELKALLAHELAHLVRGDAVWLLIGRVLCSCFAFQPLNFLARQGWRKEAEFACDDWAVRRSVSPLTLARCLTSVAGRRLSQTACEATLAAGGPRSNLSQRVERLVENHTPDDPRSARRTLFAPAALVVVVALTIWGPGATLMAERSEPTRTPFDVLPAPAFETDSLQTDRLADHDTERMTATPQFETASTESLAEIHADELTPQKHSDEIVAEELLLLQKELDRLDVDANLLHRSLADSTSQSGLQHSVGRLQSKIEAIKRRRGALKLILARLQTTTTDKQSPVSQKPTGLKSMNRTEPSD